MFNIDQVAELYRPNENYRILADASYTNYSGLKVEYLSDNEIPTQATLDAVDFSNINTIDLWHRYGLSVGKDYISTRINIYNLVVAAGGFANLTSAEQQLAAEYFVVNRADRLTVFGTQEALEEAGLEYHAQAKDARCKRYQKSLIHVYNMVPQPDANAIASDFFSYGISTLYTESGVKGTLWGDGDIEGMLDYVNATVGTAFEPNGLRVNDATPEASTMTQIADDVIAIIMEDLI